MQKIRLKYTIKCRFCFLLINIYFEFTSIIRKKKSIFAAEIQIYKLWPHYNWMPRSCPRRISSRWSTRQKRVLLRDLKASKTSINTSVVYKVFSSFKSHFSGRIISALLHFSGRIIAAKIHFSGRISKLFANFMRELWFISAKIVILIHIAKHMG